MLKNLPPKKQKTLRFTTRIKQNQIEIVYLNEKNLNYIKEKPL